MTQPKNNFGASLRQIAQTSGSNPPTFATWVNTSKEQNCPICGSTKNWCSYSTSWIDEVEVVSAAKCMRSTGAIPAGWRLLRPAPNGGYLFALDRDRPAENNPDFAPIAAAPKITSTRSLVDEIAYRHRGYRQVAAQFGRLAQPYRTEVADRGLSVLEIDALEREGYLFNWETCERINRPVGDLPGIHPTGMTTTGWSGLAIAAMTVTGKIAGAQIMPKQMTRQARSAPVAVGDETTIEIYKYYWISSKNVGGGVPRLPELEEVPMNCYRPEGIVNTLFLCEGLLKSTISGVRLNRSQKGIAVMGASGGIFSIRQILSAIEHLGVKKVVFAPDAGSGANPNLLLQYQKIVDALKNQPFSVEIADWGQIDNKEAGDLDEIADPSEIRYRHDLDLFRFKLPMPNWEDDPEELEEIRAIEAEGLRLMEEASRPLTDEEFIKMEIGKARNKLIKTMLSYDRYLPGEPIFRSLTKNASVGVKSGMGTGKTYRLEELAIKAKAEKLRLIFVGYRNQLLKAIEDRIPGSYLIVDNPLFRNNYDDHLLLCHHSIDKIAPELFENAIVVFDEAAAIHMDIVATGIGKVANRRAAHCQELAQRLARAHSLLMLDAQLSDTAIEFFTDLSGAGDEQARWEEYVYANTYVNPMQIRISNKSSDAERDLLITEILERLGQGERILVSADAKKLLAAIAKAAQKVIAKESILLITQETNNQADQIAFITNPGKYIERSKPQLVLISPTAESGIDISVDYFQAHYHFHRGVTGIDSLMQFLGRERNFQTCPKTLWIGRPQSANFGNRQFNADWDADRETTQKMLAYKLACNGASAADPQMQATYERIYRDCELERKIQRAQILLECEKFYLRDLAIEQLQYSGHQVSFFDVAATETEAIAARVEVKAAKTELALETATEYLNTEPTLDAAKARAVLEDPNASRPLVLDAQKSLFALDFPGLKHDPAWTQIELWHVYANTDKIVQLESLNLLLNPELARTQMVANAERFAESGGRFGDLPTRPTYARAAHLAGIDRLINVSYSDGDPLLQEIIAKIVACPLLGARQQGSQDDCEYIGKLAARFGLKPKLTSRVRARDPVTGKVLTNAVRHYTLVPITTDDPILTAIFDAILRRNSRHYQKIG